MPLPFRKPFGASGLTLEAVSCLFIAQQISASRKTEMTDLMCNVLPALDNTHTDEAYMKRYEGHPHQKREALRCTFLP